MTQAYRNKVDAAYKAAGMGDHVLIGLDKHYSLYQMASAKLSCAIFEASPEFQTLTTEEMIAHKAIRESIENAARTSETRYGAQAMERVNLAIALKIAYRFIPESIKNPDDSLEIPGLYAYQFLPLQLHQVVHNSSPNESVSLFPFDVDPTILAAYQGVFNALQKHEASIPAAIHGALEVMNIDLPTISKSNTDFAKEYADLAEECRHPFSDANQELIVQTLPEAKHAAAREAIAFIRDFPEKPSLRECDRYLALTRYNHSDDAPLPTFAPRSSPHTALQKTKYQALVRNLSGEFPNSIRASWNALPKDDIHRISELEETLDYFTTAYEDVAYPGKLSAYRDSAISQFERVRKMADAILKTGGSMKFMKRPSSATLTEKDRARFDAYTQNKAAFDSIKEALVYDEPITAAPEILDHARAYLHELERKTREVVSIVQTANPNSANNLNDDDDDFELDKDEKLANQWYARLKDAVYDKNDYIQKLDATCSKLHQIDGKLAKRQYAQEQQRDKAISEMAYDPALTVIVTNMPKQLKQTGSDKIDADAVAELQSRLNDRMADLQKRYFSGLKTAPLVKIKAHKNKLVLCVQEIGTEMLIDALKNLAKDNPSRLDEALGHAKKGLLNALSTAIRQEYGFLKETDITIPSAATANRRVA